MKKRTTDPLIEALLIKKARKRKLEPPPTSPPAPSLLPLIEAFEDEIMKRFDDPKDVDVYIHLDELYRLDEYGNEIRSEYYITKHPAFEAFWRWPGTATEKEREWLKFRTEWTKRHPTLRCYSHPGSIRIRY